MQFGIRGDIPTNTIYDLSYYASMDSSETIREYTYHVDNDINGQYPIVICGQGDLYIYEIYLVK